MRVVPAAVRTAAPDDPLLGLPLPSHVAHRCSLAHSRSRALELDLGHSASDRLPHNNQRHHHNHHHQRSWSPQPQAPFQHHHHSHTNSTPAQPSAPASFASFSFESNNPSSSSCTPEEEENIALRAIRARVPLADRHIERLVSAVDNWADEHSSAPPPPDNIEKLLLHKLHAHLPLDDGTHYSLRLSIRTPSDPSSAHTSRSEDPSSSVPVLPSSPPTTKRCASYSPGHAPWTITAHVAPAPPIAAAPPTVRLDSGPSRRYPVHPEPLDVAAAFGVMHKTSARQRYESAQQRVKANLTPQFIRYSNVSPRLLKDFVPVPDQGGVGRKRSATLRVAPPSIPVDRQTGQGIVTESPHPRSETVLELKPGVLLPEGQAQLDTREPVFDALLWSRDAMGHTRFLESGIANLIFEDLTKPEDKPDRFVTPTVKPRDGPLPGMMRKELVARGVISEEDVSVEEVLEHPEKWRIFLCNAVRGMFEVRLVP